MSYKALMLSGVPNFVYTIGYTNASWTLKADLVCEYVVRLLDPHGPHRPTHLRRRARTPPWPSGPSWTWPPATSSAPSTSCPRQGDRAPWMFKQNYLVDVRTIRRRQDRRRGAAVRLRAWLTPRGAMSALPRGAVADRRRRATPRRPRTDPGGTHGTRTTRSATRPRTSRARPRRAPARPPATRASRPRARATRPPPR